MLGLGLEYWDNGNRLLERTRTDKHLKKLRLAASPSRVIHRENKTRVLFFEKTPTAGVDCTKRRTPILIVPSLINRHYILDLLPDKSLIRFLCQRGFDVAMIDWGMPGDEDRHIPFERFVDTYIDRAIQAVGRETGIKKPVLLGYCLGGTMTAVHAAHRPENVAGLIALTAPINFHNSGLLSAWCRTNHDIDLLVEAFGNVPWHLMQSTFQWLRPTMNAARSLTMWRRKTDEDFIESSLALEVWVNDNVSFPGECYREMIKTLYRDNGLINGTLKLYGEAVDFKRLTCPVLNVAASDDHIVPLDATRALGSLAKSDDYTELLTPGGHIGAVISKKASAVLWPHMANWLESRFTVDSEEIAEPKTEIAAEALPVEIRVTTDPMLGPVIEAPISATGADAEVPRPKRRAARATISKERRPKVATAQTTSSAASDTAVGETARVRIRPWQAPLS